MKAEILFTNVYAVQGTGYTGSLGQNLSMCKTLKGEKGIFKNSLVSFFLNDDKEKEKMLLIPPTSSELDSLQMEISALQSTVDI